VLRAPPSLVAKGATSSREAGERGAASSGPAKSALPKESFGYDPTAALTGADDEDDDDVDMLELLNNLGV
jgi:hypothetical protein